MPELYYKIFNTPAGWMGIAGSGLGLRRVVLPQPALEDAQRILGDVMRNSSEGRQRYDPLIERLIMFFQGKRVDFNDELDLTSGTPFQREVWEATMMITYGDTRSYRWVAERIGKPKAMRAVGQALGRNPLPVIVPCHRVISSDGKPGGFGGGPAMKMLLLNLEKQQLVNR